MPPPAPAAALPLTPTFSVAPEPDPSTLGILEGRVLDARTGKGIAGIDVTCQQDGRFESAYTDQAGRYRVEMPAGDCVVDGAYGDARTGEHHVRLEAQRTVTLDLHLDPRALTAALAKTPPENCPGSKPTDIVEGSVPSQRDLDAIIRIALGNGIPDQRGDAVRAEIDGRLTISPAALPEGYVLRTRAELEAEATRTNGAVWFVAFSSVYATKTCAKVRVGGNFVEPKALARTHLKMCCCSATDFYAKRNGTWKFVRRSHRVCA